MNHYCLDFLDLDVIKQYRKIGLVFFNQIRPWENTTSQFGGADLKSQTDLVKFIKNGSAGDIYFHWVEQDDPIMCGFEKETGYPFQSILVAANKKLYDKYSDKYKAYISFVGSLLPEKKEFMKQHLSPIRKRYQVKIYGSDWTLTDKCLGYAQKFGQYFDINFLKKVRGIKLPFEDERKVYSSSLISLNVHENHQRKFGCDFNERTLKIIASGGFEICDKVRVLRKYFNEQELVIAEDTDDWFDKIDYFMKNPEKRTPIIETGMKKVLDHHTYHNRVNQFIELYLSFKRGHTS